MKHNQENCERLAAVVVTELGQELTKAYATKRLVEHYQNNPEAFAHDAEALIKDKS
jgi:hypothetical protein